MATLTYNPGIFRVPDVTAAKAIILTAEGGQTTDERWARETPYLTDLLGGAIQAGPGDLVVDFGCGLGRMSKALIARYGCRVLGVDTSQDMRAMATAYVGSDAFSVVSGAVFAALVAGGLKADAAISVWVLQHCLNVAEDIARLADGLKPGGRLGVVNTYGRVVPTVEKVWASDGQDVRALLGAVLTPQADGALDPAVVGEPTSRGTFWASYVKA